MPRTVKPRWHAGNRMWYARIGDPDPKGKARPVYFKGVEPGDERGAWKAMEAELRRRASARAEAADPTVEGLAELYLEWCEGRVAAGEMTANHFNGLRSKLARFAESVPPGSARPMGERKARLVGAADLEGFVGWAKARYTPHYVRGLARAIQGAYHWAARPVPGREPARLLAANPLAGTRAPAVPRSPERFAERREAAAFLAFFRRYADRHASGTLERKFDRRTILLERVLIRTGCRPGEACAARWCDVKWDGGRTSAGHAFAKIVLPPGRWKSGKSTGRHRPIYLTPTLTRALRRLQARPDRHPTHLFSHRLGPGGRERGADPRAGEPWNAVALGAKIRKIRRAAIRAGVDLPDVGPGRIVNYLWRHTAISTLLMMGVDVATVAELTGTGEAMIRQTYGHILDDHLARAAEALQGKRRP